ncbi:histidinol-phosphatase HisJ [Bacillus sp. 03113]|uniref:histidinol-phosphatase HisJ n=1 Tax=Bacillus sp. 03113 TaxID=2578211 RepID=UPI001141942F|nr:histidinol-phosphatase HisJ [Bacillus sp. 03113]
MKKDGHIHTPYCPHGTKDKLTEYVERALSLGFTEISFTEHAPLPKGFVDTAPTKDSAISSDLLDSYFDEISQLKVRYSDKIKINAGLEVDYIEGYEKETTSLLNSIGSKLDDAVLSVHFLKNGDRYDCLDYSPDYFEGMIHQYGSIEKIYDQYYRTLLMSIEANLGDFKPKRIGHITLARKFQKRFPSQINDQEAIISVLHAIKKQGYEIDYNGAGLRKPLCKETYPPLWVVNEAKKLQIPLVYGSDAHQVKELGQGYAEMQLDS